MSNNQSTLVDLNQDYSDWIEIYNAGSSSVNLSGYALSDTPDTLQKWFFPPTLIGPNSFKLIWCSGKNLTTPNLHTNFTISSLGKTIFISDASGNVIDNVSVPALSADVVYGRHTDGDANWYYLSSASPNQSNNSSLPFFGAEEFPPVFSLAGGFYTSAQTLTLSHSDPNAVIHYTTDGSDPDENSPIYSGPISIQSRVGDPNLYSMIRTCYNVHPWLPDWNPPANQVFKCNIIRARAIRPNFLPGPIQTHSYFVDPNIFARYGNLPVVSLVSDPKNLFNDTTGIYVPGINYQPGTFHANYYKAWNRPANVELFLPGGLQAVNGNFEIGVNGQSSPSSPQKGLNINASPDYGPVKFEYPLFENTRGTARYIQKFDKIKFRAWGSDRDRGLFRDAYCASFFAKSTLDFEAYQPCVIFIDGEYWGLQEMRERNRDGEYYESHYLVDSKAIDILDGAGNNVIEGNSNDWDDLTNYLAANDLSIQSNYDYVKTRIDIQSFILHYMASIYFSRADWPDQNEAKWRPQIAGAKWKWILWDMDNTSAYYLNPWYDMFNQVVTGSRGYGPSLILNQLLANDEFKSDFINLFADYMNTDFLPLLAQKRVDQMRDELNPYMSEYRLRWQTNYNWQAQTDSMKWWVNLRPSFCKQQILSTFGIQQTVSVTLNVSDSLKGKIKINTILLDENTPRTTAHTFPWTGDYFKGVQVRVTAIARPGYRFVRWTPGNNTNPSQILNLNNNTSLTAVFDVDPNVSSYSPPVINEVMASNTNSIADNYGQYDDWLEIYNPGGDTLDLAGMYLTDHLVLPTRFQIASGNDSTKIAPHGYKIFWLDDDASQGVLHTNFKLSTQFSMIALVGSDGETIIDSIRFTNSLSDVSFGRRSDGSSHWINFAQSTPDATNWYNSGMVFINELSTNNQSVVADEFGEYDQWLELYNPNADSVM
ncbi:MAG: CotH kinase family protein [Bacteroidetes bacterium]|nr:CotH kinase family protein [Bacteroidota bacterium]